MNFDMDSSLGFVLNKTALFTKAGFNTRIKKFAISPEQWSLLFRVVEHNGLSQKELADSTYKDQANIGRTVDRLEAKGLLKRVQNEEDRRSILLYPSKEAEELVAKISIVSDRFNKELTKDFSEQEISQLLSFLKRIEINLNNGET